MAPLKSVASVLPGDVGDLNGEEIEQLICELASGGVEEKVLVKVGESGVYIVRKLHEEYMRGQDIEEYMRKAAIVNACMEKAAATKPA